jgi:hypothetical protein
MGTHADQDDVGTAETAGLAQVGLPSVVHAADRIYQGGLLRAVVGDLRR